MKLELESRAKSSLEVSRYSGEAQLLWNDQVVQSLSFDADFVQSGGLKILSHQDSDGTVVEYHVYTQAECKGFAGGLPATLTRAEVDALEQ